MKELTRDLSTRQEAIKNNLSDFKSDYMNLPLKWRVVGTVAFFGSAIAAGTGLGIAVSIAKLYF
ncbi:hypothetical protein HYW46_04095 [Candidatus Daviesbacteria bacterium]|nr:hypothetical protein [Candidatus Daviesbacteria bacterium]